MMQTENHNRAIRAERLLEYAGNGYDLHTTLVDLLADAMHWADVCGGDFHLALAQACRHYVNELNDDQTDERRINP